MEYREPMGQAEPRHGSCTFSVNQAFRSDDVSQYLNPVQGWCLERFGYHQKNRPMPKLFLQQSSPLNPLLLDFGSSLVYPSPPHTTHDYLDSLFVSHSIKALLGDYKETQTLRKAVFG